MAIAWALRNQPRGIGVWGSPTASAAAWLRPGNVHGVWAGATSPLGEDGDVPSRRCLPEQQILLRASLGLCCNVSTSLPLPRPSSRSGSAEMLLTSAPGTLSWLHQRWRTAAWTTLPEGPQAAFPIPGRCCLIPCLSPLAPLGLQKRGHEVAQDVSPSSSGITLSPPRPWQPCGRLLLCPLSLSGQPAAFQAL